MSVATGFSVFWYVKCGIADEWEVCKEIAAGCNRKRIDMGIVQAKDLTFEYIIRDEEDNIENVKTAVDHVSLDIEQGQFIAILGHNGSGKSTFAKHINALLSQTDRKSVGRERVC